MVSKKQTVTINGKTYDIATGKAVAGAEKPAVKPKIIADIAPQKATPLNRKITAPKRAHSPSLRQERSVAPHAKRALQKSNTLRRSVVQKPASKVKPNTNKTRVRVQKSQHITKFAPMKKDSAQESQPKIDKDLLAQTKALEKAHAEHLAAQEKRSLPVSTQAIKEHLLGQAIAKVPSHDTAHHHLPPAKRAAKRSRFASAAMASFALILLSGYLTYINIPNLSIRVAAASSGVDAKLPTYQPAGYRIHGPITYRSGEVNVKYQQGNSNLGYKLTQRPTDWDPIATLDNYVESDSNNDYQIHSVQGLTVYTYGKKAVWVNAGILHIIAGNVPLSSQDVEHIVASM